MNATHQFDLLFGVVVMALLAVVGSDLDAGLQVALIGWAGGLARFLRAPGHTWKWKAIVAFPFIGGGLGFALTSIWFGPQIHQNLWAARGYSFLIGFAQLEFARHIVPVVLKACGAKVDLETHSRD